MAFKVHDPTGMSTPEDGAEGKKHNSKDKVSTWLSEGTEAGVANRAHVGGRISQLSVDSFKPLRLYTCVPVCLCALVPVPLRLCVSVS